MRDEIGLTNVMNSLVTFNAFGRQHIRSTAHFVGAPTWILANHAIGLITLEVLIDMECRYDIVVDVCIEYAGKDVFP